ncbi:MAG: histidine kinase [Xanthomonadales bacterium]|nr:histidine kinase [Xanthomonadales bacterium]
MTPQEAAAASGWRAHLVRQLIHAVIWGGFCALSIWLFTASAGLFSGLVVIAVVLSAGLWMSSEATRALVLRRGWLALSPLALAWRLILVVAALAAAIQALIHLVLATGLALGWLRMPVQGAGYGPGAIAVYWFNTAVMLLLWTAVWAGQAAQRQSRRDSMGRLQAEAERRRLELDLLRARLNPHFVFNALNNVRALINEDPARARELVTRLSNTLRHALQHSQRERVTLAEEWAVMQDYLAVEAVHFEQRLQVDAGLDPALAGFELPPMFLQLLVENAIKHGIARTPGGGLLQVAARRGEAGGLHLTVENPGHLKQVDEVVSEPSPTGGVGLAWLRTRIAGLGPAARFRLWSPQPGRVRAELALPA